MAVNQKTIFVYDDFSTDQPHLLGCLSELDAEAQAEEILKIVRDNWEKTAARYGLTRRQIEEMRPAFNACYE